MRAFRTLPGIYSYVTKDILCLEKLDRTEAHSVISGLRIRILCFCFYSSCWPRVKKCFSDWKVCTSIVSEPRTIKSLLCTAVLSIISLHCKENKECDNRVLPMKLNGSPRWTGCGGHTLVVRERHITILRYMLLKCIGQKTAMCSFLHQGSSTLEKRYDNNNILFLQVTKLLCICSLLTELVTYASVKYSKKETTLQCSGILYPRSCA